MKTSNLKNFPQGKIFKPCTEFARAVTKGLPKKMGFSLADKTQTVKRAGFNPSEKWKPKKGQTILQDAGTPYGHVSVINKVKGNKLVLSESNYSRHNVVTHNRVISKTDKRIKGVFETKLA